VTDFLNDDGSQVSVAESLARFPDENPNPILRVSGEGTLLYANAGSASLLTHWKVRRGDAVPGALRAAVTRALQAGRPEEFELAVGEQDFCLMVTPVAGTGYVNLYGRDLTEQNQREREVRDLARFPDENPNPVLRVDDDGTVRYANGPARAVLRHWKIAVGAPIPAAIRETALVPGARARDRLIEVTVGTAEYVLQFAAVTGSGYFNVYGRDVTTQKLAERELIRARDAALEANRAKSAFLANMSHELRTPMNAIIGYSEMVVEDLTDGGHTAFTGDIEKINSAGRHLLGLINDMLDLSKIEAGGMDLYLEDFVLGDLLREVEGTMHPLVARAGNTLVLECPSTLPIVHADLTKTRQILLNLLGNACKFTKDGTITVRVEQAADAKLRIAVVDTGIGMTGEQAAKIFDAFTQADGSTTRRFGGTGLGLTIAQRFAGMMGGEIRVQSEPGRGTAFTLVMPLRARLIQQPNPRRPTGTFAAMGQDDDDGQRCVLVVDDDPVVREIVGTTLRNAGFRVVTADSGEKGLALARSEQPFAITLDVVMTGMDGWHVLTQLKADPSTQDIPVVLATVSGDRSLGYALGAADFMTKPLDRDRLVGLMRRFRTEGTEGAVGYVLIVEDDASTRELASRAMSRAGWKTRTADNGATGLQVLEEGVPSVIILDLMMPVMDGFRFLEHLRSDARFVDVPVIVTTAKNLSGEERAVLKGSVEDLLEKGAFSAESLLRRVESLAHPA